MTVDPLFEACRNGNSSYSLGNVQFDYHYGGILILLPIVVLVDMEVLSLYDVIRLVVYDLELFLLALRRSQDIHWSRYDDEAPPCFRHDFKTCYDFDIPPLCANKRFNKGLSFILYDSVHN